MVDDALRRLVAVWDELPELVGSDWEALCARLGRLIDRLRAATSDRQRTSVVAELMLALRDYPKAAQRLREADARAVRGGAAGTLADLEAQERAPERTDDQQAKEALGAEPADGPVAPSGRKHHPAVRARGAGPAPIQTSSSRKASPYPSEPDAAIAELSERFETTPLTRYTDISCPQRVWVKTPRFSVVVRLCRQPTSYSGDTVQLELEEGRPVQVRLHAPAFELLGPAEQQTSVAAGQDSVPVVFDLRPRRAGRWSLELDFAQNGNPLGTATVMIECSEEEVSQQAAEVPRRRLCASRGVAAPDMVLYIRWDASQRQLEFELIRHGGAWSRRFAPLQLHTDPQSYARGLYDEWTDLVLRCDPATRRLRGQQQALAPEQVDLAAKQRCHRLWDELTSPEFREFYARDRENWIGKTLLIISDEPHLPWELLWPYQPGGAADDGPWCCTMNVTRWLRKDAQGNGNEMGPVRLPLGRLAAVAPGDAGLPSAVDECRWLRRFVQRWAVEDVSPPTSGWTQIIGLLRTGQYDWFHLAAHGKSRDGCWAIFLDQNQSLTPDQITGPEITGHLRRRRPAFVFNACETAQGSAGLTGIAGWANRLVSLGAGLFLAPLWEVSDQGAKAFVTAFYEQLLAGQTVAAAVREARQKARASGDPTWLAYVVYAHPLARVKIGKPGRRG